MPMRSNIESKAGLALLPPAKCGPVWTGVDMSTSLLPQVCPDICANSMAPERIRKWGHWEIGGGTDPARSAVKNFWSCPSTFFALKVQLVVLVSAFVMDSTVWSVFCLLFFYSRCPPCPAICKSGGTCPRSLWSRLRRCANSVSFYGGGNRRRKDIIPM